MCRLRNIALRVWQTDRQTDGQTDRRTDGRRTKWSLCVAMLRRRHKKWHVHVFYILQSPFLSSLDMKLRDSQNPTFLWLETFHMSTKNQHQTVTPPPPHQPNMQKKKQTNKIKQTNDQTKKHVHTCIQAIKIQRIYNTMVPYTRIRKKPTGSTFRWDHDLPEIDSNIHSYKWTVSFFRSYEEVKIRLGKKIK